MSAPESVSGSRLAGPWGARELPSENSQQSAVYASLAILFGICSMVARFFYVVLKMRGCLRAQLAAIKRMPQLVRSFFQAPSVAYITDW
jgi:hypothetical protein